MTGSACDRFKTGTGETRPELFIFYFLYTVRRDSYFGISAF